MKIDHFPKLIQLLPEYAGKFEARRLQAKGCEVLFASYPAGTAIEAHSHETENCGVITEGELILTTNGEQARYGPGDWYYLASNQEHSANFDVNTSEIEFWFKSAK